MITKDEIQIIAAEKQLQPNIIEKDYVLGWILAGINNHPKTKDTWIFKGGTCLKKCYFETYRFSEDLDFTYKHAGYLPTENELIDVAKEISHWVYDNSGVEIPDAGIGFKIVPNKRGSYTVQGKLSYRGALRPGVRVTNLPRIKIDLTLDEPLILSAATRKVEHQYTDKPAGGIKIAAYACEEIFAEKIRALIQRLRPRDLYDVIHLYRRKELSPNVSILKEVLAKKCNVRNVAFPTMQMIVAHEGRKFLESEWEIQLKHQLPVLPYFDDFLNELPEVFNWIAYGGVRPSLPILNIASEGAVEKLAAQSINTFMVPGFGATDLEKIRFAAANHLVINLRYQGRYREIEPYSFAKSAARNILLYAVKYQTGETRCYRLDRIESVEVLTKTYVPRYEIEITATGMLPVHRVKR
jgi:predicted nucleotidyltransferase component of viral defense system